MYKWRMKKKSYGSENSDKCFYIVRRSSGNTGLFSYVCTNMGQVAYALEEGFIPIIDMQNNANIYLHEEEIGVKNAWELFFEQPCGFRLCDISRSKNIILGNGIIGDVPYPSMKMIKDEAELMKWRTLFHGYLQIKDEIVSEIEAKQQELLAGKRILGVLCRGTDYTNVRPSRHPVQPTLTQIFEKVDEVLENQKCDIIYLATEDEDVYQAFLLRYQEKLVTMQTQRYRNTGATNINEFIVKNSNIYQNSRDYLVSIALLSRCNCLVAGCTSGTYAVLAMSKGYEYQYVFDLGVYE
ncbi:MAG: hypothetical protein LBC96_09715 [Lachnospiraceae bacterium]|jgi:hypothetical protein|nr:hypothetical protein [Lachnospiraceae bacterium]